MMVFPSVQEARPDMRNKLGTTKVQPDPEGVAGAEAEKCDFLRKWKNPCKQPNSLLLGDTPSAPRIAKILSKNAEFRSLGTIKHLSLGANHRTSGCLNDPLVTSLR